MSGLDEIVERACNALTTESDRRHFAGASPLSREDTVRLIVCTALGRPNPFDRGSRNLMAVQRLATEAAEREARERSWDLVSSVLSHTPKEQIDIEINPLYLGGNEPSSYLEQAQIRFPEVYPGHAAPIRDALVLMIDLLPHIQRDRLTDAERLEIGWADMQEPPA